MSLYEVYTTKMCHDLAGVIGTLGNTIECMEIDDTFLTDGIGLLKNSGKDDIATIATLSGVVIALIMVLDLIGKLFNTVKTMFGF